MRYFLVKFGPGPAWQKDADVYGQALDGHLEYINLLYSVGIVLMAGPFADGSGGMTIVQFASLAEAETLMAADPAVRDGVLRPDIREWRPIAWGFEPGTRTPYEDGLLTSTRQS